MNAIRRNYLSLLVLSSFALANVGAWMHFGLGCGGDGGHAACFSVADPADRGSRLRGCCEASTCDGSATRAALEVRTAGRSATITPPPHARDACVICQFLLAAKSLAQDSELGLTVGTIPAQVVLDVATWTVSPCTRHPDCRASPLAV
jgi:hypothetical protein